MSFLTSLEQALLQLEMTVQQIYTAGWLAQYAELQTRECYRTTHLFETQEPPPFSSPPLGHAVVSGDLKWSVAGQLVAAVAFFVVVDVVGAVHGKEPDLELDTVGHNRAEEPESATYSTCNGLERVLLNWDPCERQQEGPAVSFRLLAGMDQEGERQFFVEHWTMAD